MLAPLLLTMVRDRWKELEGTEVVYVWFRQVIVSTVLEHLDEEFYKLKRTLDD